MSKKLWCHVHLFWHSTDIGQTDRQMDRIGKTISCSACWHAVKMHNNWLSAVKRCTKLPWRNFCCALTRTHGASSEYLPSSAGSPSPMQSHQVVCRTLSVACWSPDLVARPSHSLSYQETRTSIDFQSIASSTNCVYIHKQWNEIMGMGKIHGNGVGTGKTHGDGDSLLYKVSVHTASHVQGSTRVDYTHGWP